MDNVNSTLLERTDIIILRATPTHGTVRVFDQSTDIPIGEGTGTAHILYYDKAAKTFHCQTVVTDFSAYPVEEFDHTDNELDLQEAKKLLDEYNISY